MAKNRKAKKCFLHNQLRGCNKCFFGKTSLFSDFSSLRYTPIIVRFLALVTTMVTMVDHGNHRSNDRGNDRSNHHGYYDRYYNVNA